MLTLMEFSQLLVPSYSSSVWEYNYTQNAYSSFCLPAAYSVRCISHEAEEMRSLYLSVRLTVCKPASQIILDQAAGDMASRWQSPNYEKETGDELQCSLNLCSSPVNLILFSYARPLLTKHFRLHYLHVNRIA